MIQKVSVFLVLCLVIGFQGLAQKKVVDWSFAAKKVSAEEYDVTFTATVKSGWYIYSQFLVGDGPIPTSFEFEKITGVQYIGKTKEVGNKKEGFDEVFGMNVMKFSGIVTFTQRIKTKSAKTITGYLTYMTCDDEQCLPPMDVDFSINLPK